jgi:hypothetical protein
MVHGWWSRYHLLPQLGLALLVSGGLPRWHGRLFDLDPTGRLSRRQVQALALLIAVLLGTQVYHDAMITVPYDPAQQEALRRIEETDARCREHHVRAETARRALGTLHVPGGGETDNGWDLLVGSDDPRPVSVEEARRLLAAAD